MAAPKTMAAVLTLVLLVSACDQEIGSGPGPAATVNGEEIPASEVDEQVEAVTDDPQFEQQAEMMGGEEVVEAQVKAQTLTQLINATLIRQGAEAEGIDITEEDVAEQREELEEQIAEQMEGMTLEELAEQQGISEEQVDQELELLAYQDALVEQMAAEGEIEDEEVAEARHVLIAPDPEAEEDDDAAEERAEAVRERIEDGEDFAEVAEEVSDDPGSAEEGGDLGEFSEGDFGNPEFEEPIFAAETGDLLGPIQSPSGWHVIEVLALETRSYDELGDETRMQRQQELIQEWLQERIAEADVEVEDDYGTWDPETGQVQPDLDEDEMMPPEQPMPEEAPEELDEEELEEELEELEGDEDADEDDDADEDADDEDE